MRRQPMSGADGRRDDGCQARRMRRRNCNRSESGERQQRAARENTIGDHRASTAAQRARTAKDRGMDANLASESAQQKLPNVSASCSDTKLIKQTPMDFNSPVCKRTIIFAGKQRGYAASYRPGLRTMMCKSRSIRAKSTVDPKRGPNNRSRNIRAVEVNMGSLAPAATTAGGCAPATCMARVHFRCAQ